MELGNAVLENTTVFPSINNASTAYHKSSGITPLLNGGFGNWAICHLRHRDGPNCTLGHQNLAIG